MSLCLLTSLKVSGQVNKFESKELQKAATLLSEEVPFAEVLYRFTETYLNQLLVMSEKDRSMKLKMDDMKIENGGIDQLHLVNNETVLSMRAKDNRYTICFSNGNFKLIQLSCPMSYQLITQKKLSELEKLFIKNLYAYKIKENTASNKVNKSELKKTAPYLYIKKGSNYFLDEINNDLYYIEKRGKLTQVYDPAYLAESICNMLISENVPCDISLKLIVRQYGFKTDELRIPLKQWITYCKSENCDIYVGVEKMSTNSLKACVFVVNEYFKYNHVMNVEVPYTLLEKEKGEIKAAITIYIPTHNIKTLFEEFEFKK
jgi:hypothetical protein